MSKIDILKNSLVKKEEELSKVFVNHFNFVKSLQGEPLGGTKAGIRFNNIVEKQNKKIRSLSASIEKTKEAIEKIEKKKRLAEEGKNTRGNLDMSVNNIHNIQNKVDELLSSDNNMVRGYARRYKKKIEYLEAVKNRAEQEKEILTQQTKDIIASEKITQWVKKPIYYFVKGFKKVALFILPTGDFYPTKFYLPANPEEWKKIEEFLNINFSENLEKYKNSIKK